MKTSRLAVFLLLVAVIVGTFFLTSAGRGQKEGAVPWSADSWLRPIVELLNLRYTVPTPHGVEIKRLALALGTAGVLVLVPWAGRRDEWEVPAAAAGAAERSSAGGMAPADAALVLLGLYVLWAFISAKWSFAPGYALAGSAGMGIGVAWAIGLGLSLDRATALRAARWLAWLSVAMAGLAIWYFHERLPGQRAEYPIGNPLFLAACLLPAVFLLGGSVLHAGRELERGWNGRLGLSGLVHLAGLAVVVVAIARTCTPWSEDATWADVFVHLTVMGSKSAYVGLLAGVLAWVFFVGRRAVRIAVVVIACTGAVLFVVWMIPGLITIEAFGRGASVRLRAYAWQYALAFIAQRPTTGGGMGAFALRGDSLAAQDALNDPLAFPGRLSHVHNEWLEVLVDLGSVGLCLIGVALVLAVYGGMRALSHVRGSADRVTLVALLAALVALVGEECFNVALRITGLPAVFFTVAGLILACGREERWGGGGERGRLVRWGTRLAIPAGLVGGVAVAAVGYLDFASARAQVRAFESVDAADLPRAVALARTSWQWRLDPVRRLEAGLAALRVHYIAAQDRLRRAEDRLRRAREDVAAGARLEALARQDREEGVAWLIEGIELAQRMRFVTPGYAGLGDLEARLRSLAAHVEAQAGNRDIAEQHRQEAIVAVATELKRHGSNARLAAEYLDLAPDLPFAERLKTILRALRCGLVPAELRRHVARLAEQRAYAEAEGQMLAEAYEIMSVVAEDESQAIRLFDSLVPERFRLAGWVAHFRKDFAAAAEHGERAAALYARMGTLPITHVYTLSEVAWNRFLLSPEDPEAAIEVQRLALESVPRIGQAEEMKRSLRLWLGQYLLAAGRNEEALRVLLGAVDRPAPEGQVLAEAWVNLGFGVLNSGTADHWGFVERCARRALESAEVPAPAWRLVAEMALRRGQPERLVEAVDALGQAGADPRSLLTLLERAERVFPESEAVRQRLEALRGAFGASGGAGPELGRSEVSTRPAWPPSDL